MTKPPLSEQTLKVASLLLVKSKTKPPQETAEKIRRLIIVSAELRSMGL